jgi:hypothetical protein
VHSLNDSRQGKQGSCWGHTSARELPEVGLLVIAERTLLLDGPVWEQEGCDVRVVPASNPAVKERPCYGFPSCTQAFIMHTLLTSPHRWDTNDFFFFEMIKIKWHTAVHERSGTTEGLCCEQGPRPLAKHLQKCETRHDVVAHDCCSSPVHNDTFIVSMEVSCLLHLGC